MYYGAEIRGLESNSFVVFARRGGRKLENLQKRKFFILNIRIVPDFCFELVFMLFFMLVFLRQKYH